MARPPEKKSISDKFGLGFLIDEPEKAAPVDVTQQQGVPRAGGIADSFLDDLAAFATRALLVAIREEERVEPGAAGVHLKQVARRAGMDARVMLPLIDRSVEAEMVHILERDDFGDHKVALTEETRRLIDDSGGGELMRRLYAVRD